MADSRDPSPSSAADPAERLVVEVLALPEAEQSRALEAAIERHPELASEVRARWLALQALGLSTAPPREFPEQLGEFRLIEPLGRGGMGVVYRAEQSSLGREVALKVLRPDRLFFEGAHERFRREVEAIAGLQHPGIVPVYSVGEDQGIPYFAMERIAGATLAEVLEELAGRAPEELTGADLAHALEARSGLRCDAAPLFERSWVDACVELASRVAEALDHAHRRGILHRDVKPSNVALTADGRALLLDFGLASSENALRLTESGDHVGTFLYMAPEQLRAEADLGPAVDVYGLGVSLAEALALRHPFEGGARLDVERRVLAGTRDPLRTANRRVPPELELVVAKALDLDPARRYASCAALAADLRAVLERRPVAARPIGPLLAARRWVQREPAKAVALVAALLLFGVAPSVLFLRERAHGRELSDSLLEEQLARREAEESFAFLEGLIAQADPARAMDGSVTVREALAAGVAQLDELEDQPRLKARLELSIGETYNTLGQFEDALSLLERAAIAEEELGEPLKDALGFPREAQTLALLALGRLDEAEAVVTPLLETRTGELRGRLLYFLASIRQGQGRVDESLPLLIEARDEYAARDDEEGREGWLGISSLLASVYRRLDRPAEALEVAEACLAGAEEFYPAGHIAIADALDAVAHAREALGEHARAFETFEEAIAMVEELYGSESIALARYVANYGNALARAKQGEDARSYLEWAHRIYLAELGPQNPVTRGIASTLASLR